MNKDSNEAYRYDLERTLTEINQLEMTGNVIPPDWFSKITFEKGKPDVLSRFLLADIIYWYKPQLIRDEKTGKILGYQKKFKADILQKSNRSYAEQFGYSTRQVSESLKRLVDSTLIHKELRTIDSANGKLTHVQFIASLAAHIALLESDVPLMKSIWLAVLIYPDQSICCPKENTQGNRSHEWPYFKAYEEIPSDRAATTESTAMQELEYRLPSSCLNIAVTSCFSATRLMVRAAINETVVTAVAKSRNSCSLCLVVNSHEKSAIEKPLERIVHRTQ